MSYTPTTWQTGDTVTAEKLNNMETGIENAANAFIVTLTPTALDYSGTMDKTVAEIDAAYQAGKQILFSLSDGTNTFMVPLAYSSTNSYGTYFVLYILDTYNNLIINANTSREPEATTYSTVIYALTPAS